MCQNCIANYGGDNTTKIYWFTIDFIDIKHVSCKPEHCLIRANKKYKGYCATCFQNLFPLDPLTLQIHSKTKEIAVRDFINSNYEGFQHDKPLYTPDCNCTIRRRG